MKLLVFLFVFTSLFGDKPELFLLNRYSIDMNISGWYMSEKLDGVRAYWAGEKLISRSGRVFAAPAFFTKDFPKSELDGELWSKRQDFSNISSIVNSNKKDKRWEQLTYNIFEVPNAKGDLLQRLSNVSFSKYIRVIKQIKVKDRTQVENYLKDLVSKGAEGLVLRDASLTYYTGRNNSALKVKTYMDTECEVLGYTKGRGKYENLIGALVCKMENNDTIKIGSGFTKKERVNPPKIGAIITFKYYGLTSKGNPRFPVYLRERN